LRWRHDVEFALKLIVALLVLASIMGFALWGDPLYWVKVIRESLGLAWLGALR